MMIRRAVDAVGSFLKPDWTMKYQTQAQPGNRAINEVLGVRDSALQLIREKPNPGGNYGIPLPAYKERYGGWEPRIPNLMASGRTDAGGNLAVEIQGFKDQVPTRELTELSLNGKDGRATLNLRAQVSEGQPRLVLERWLANGDLLTAKSDNSGGAPVFTYQDATPVGRERGTRYSEPRVIPRAEAERILSENVFVPADASSAVFGFARGLAERGDLSGLLGLGLNGAGAKPGVTFSADVFGFEGR